MFPSCEYFSLMFANFCQGLFVAPQKSFLTELINQSYSCTANQYGPPEFLVLLLYQRVKHA